MATLSDPILLTPQPSSNILITNVVHLAPSFILAQQAPSKPTTPTTNTSQESWSTS